MNKQFLEVGEVVTTHGIAGELRVYPWSDDNDFLAGFTRVYTSPDLASEIKIEQAKPHKNISLVRFEGIDSIEKARPLIGKTLYINREDITLEPGRYFIQDLLGLKVLDANTGYCYGSILNITHPGHHDVYEVETKNGSKCLIPGVEPFLKEINLEEGCVKIEPIEGMFEEQDLGEKA